jgi:hypothetical protein
LVRKSSRGDNEYALSMKRDDGQGGVSFDHTLITVLFVGNAVQYLLEVHNQQTRFNSFAEILDEVATEPLREVPNNAMITAARQWPAGSGGGGGGGMPRDSPNNMRRSDPRDIDRMSPPQQPADLPSKPDRAVRRGGVPMPGFGAMPPGGGGFNRQGVLPTGISPKGGDEDGDAVPRYTNGVRGSFREAPLQAASSNNSNNGAGMRQQRNGSPEEEQAPRGQRPWPSPEEEEATRFNGGAGNRGSAALSTNRAAPMAGNLKRNSEILSTSGPPPFGGIGSGNNVGMPQPGPPPIPALPPFGGIGTGNALPAASARVPAIDPAYFGADKPANAPRRAQGVAAVPRDQFGSRGMPPVSPPTMFSDDPVRMAPNQPRRAPMPAPATRSQPPVDDGFFGGPGVRAVPRTDVRPDDRMSMRADDRSSVRQSMDNRRADDWRGGSSGNDFPGAQPNGAGSYDDDLRFRAAPQQRPDERTASFGGGRARAGTAMPAMNGAAALPVPMMMNNGGGGGGNGGFRGSPDDMGGGGGGNLRRISDTGGGRDDGFRGGNMNGGGFQNDNVRDSFRGGMDNGPRGGMQNDNFRGGSVNGAMDNGRGMQNDNFRGGSVNGAMDNGRGMQNDNFRGGSVNGAMDNGRSMQNDGYRGGAMDSGRGGMPNDFRGNGAMDNGRGAMLDGGRGGMMDNGRPTDSYRGDGGRGNDGRGNDGRGNDGRGSDGRGNDGRGNDGRGNDGRGNDNFRGGPAPGAYRGGGGYDGDERRQPDVRDAMTPRDVSQRRATGQDGPFQCREPKCGNSYFSQSDLDRHTTLRHARPADLKFKCRECGKSYAQQGLLDRHSELRHKTSSRGGGGGGGGSNARGGERAIDLPEPTRAEPTRAEPRAGPSAPGDLMCRESGSLDSHRIEAKDLEMRKVLGQGRFGRVRCAKWKGKDVAVKELMGDYSRKDVFEFEDEAKRMKRLPPHRNIVEFYGVAEIDGKMLLVSALASHGALSDALYGEDPMVWQPRQLLRVAKGSAAGFVHLHSFNIVHRDISARNVLLHRNREPKITDFGLSRTLEDGADRQQTRCDVGPVRWMGPEEMEKKTYSFKSDVFAFGVLLFEIYAAELPWGEMTNIQVAALVMGGQRLTLPDRIPGDIKELQKWCWAQQPENRPTMAQVLERLQGLSGDEDTDSE